MGLTNVQHAPQELPERSGGCLKKVCKHPEGPVDSKKPTVDPTYSGSQDRDGAVLELKQRGPSVPVCEEGDLDLRSELHGKTLGLAGFPFQLSPFFSTDKEGCRLKSMCRVLSTRLQNHNQPPVRGTKE